MWCDHQTVESRVLTEVSDSVERVIALARSIDFDLLAGNGESLGLLVTEARYLAELTDDGDPFELSQSLLLELRQRRRLPPAPP
jgi:hypothetical protein